MGKVKEFLIILLFAVILLSFHARGQEISFREYDQQSLELYSQGKWKQLISLSDLALKQGIDYYYLRIRAGIACFETRRYMKAVIHFRKAREFNTGDPLAGEYIYACYLELNRHADAEDIYASLPSDTRGKLKNSLPGHNRADMMTGPLLSDQEQVYDTLDLDADDNVYGEADIMKSGVYFSAGISHEFTKGYSIYGAYSLVRLNKNKLVEIGDTLKVNDSYPLSQHQVYFSGHIPVLKGFSVTPAFNLILDSYETVIPELSEDSAGYLFPVEKIRTATCLGYLSLDKDFRVAKTGLFAAYSNFNESDQFQAGFNLTFFPLGNLDFYLISKLLNHRNSGRNHIIFDQVIGARIFRPLWAEVSGTVGRMENYHEGNGFVIYNIADAMKFKASASLLWMIGSRLAITAEYLYLRREGNYTSYQVGEDSSVFPVTKTLDFSNHIILAGIKWSF